MVQVADKKELKLNDGIFGSPKGYVYMFIFYFLLTLVLNISRIVSGVLPLGEDGLLEINLFEYIKIAVADGEFPLWNDYLNAGRPFVGDLANALFYIPRVIFSFLPVGLFFYFYYAFHLAFGATFFSLYLDEIKCSKYISVLFSAVYYFSICLGGFRKSHILLWSCMALFPAVIYFLEKYFNSGKKRFLILTSVVLASQFLVEFPQDAVYTDIVCGVYFLTLAFEHKVKFKKWFLDGVTLVGVYVGLIAMKLVPYVEYLSFAKSIGGEKISLDYFRSLSVSPLWLMKMFFPDMVIDESVYLNASMYNPELTEEFFIGTIAVPLMILALIFVFKNRTVAKTFCFFAGATFFSCMPSNELMAKVLYRIPLISECRCSSRIIFVITFFSMALAATGLDILIKEKRYRTFSVILFSDIVFILVFSKIVETTIATGNIWFMIFVLAVAFALCWLSYYKPKTEDVFVLLVVASIAVDLFPYWYRSAEYDVKEYGTNTPLEEFLSENSGDNKVLLASPFITGAYESVVSSNANIAMKVSSINSFTNVNSIGLSNLLTPKELIGASYNFSGIYTGFPQMSINLAFNNDVLSMLGVKYIIDQEGLMSEDMKIYDALPDDATELINVPYMLFPVQDEICAYQYEIPAKSNTLYKISFNYTGRVEGLYYVDFYGGASYDSFNQQIVLNFDSDEGKYTFYINSEDVSVAEGPIYCRFISENCDREFEITDFKLYEINATEGDYAYNLVYSDDEVNVYENINCKDLIYPAGSVEVISDVNELYANTFIHDFDDISYIVGGESLTSSDAVVTDINHRHNSTSCVVTSEGRSFINFSQTYMPGWKAYVDGKETELYMVNGYIQGIYVDGGTHTVEFKYSPNSFYVGIAVEVLTVVCLGLGAYISLKRKPREAVENKA